MVGRLRWGKTQGGVRWKRITWPADFCTIGRNWMVEAPVPTMATRRPVRSCAWFHWAEWKVVPANDEAPGSSGMNGSESSPPP